MAELLSWVNSMIRNLRRVHLSITLRNSLYGIIDMEDELEDEGNTD